MLAAGKVGRIDGLRPVIPAEVAAEQRQTGDQGFVKNFLSRAPKAQTQRTNPIFGSPECYTERVAKLRQVLNESYVRFSRETGGNINIPKDVLLSPVCDAIFFGASLPFLKKTG